jgi:hypothetical protein
MTMPTISIRSRRGWWRGDPVPAVRGPLPGTATPSRPHQIAAILSLVECGYTQISIRLQGRDDRNSAERQGLVSRRHDRAQADDDTRRRGQWPIHPSGRKRPCKASCPLWGEG